METSRRADRRAPLSSFINIDTIQLSSLSITKLIRPPPVRENWRNNYREMDANKHSKEHIQHPLYKVDKPNIKKLKIKNLREIEKQEPEFDTMWSLLENNLTSIMLQKRSMTSYEYLYKTACSLSRMNGQAVFGNLNQFIGEYVNLLRDEILEQMQMNASYFIENVATMWRNYHLQMTMVRSIFLQLEKRSGLETFSTISEIFVGTFRSFLLHNSAVREKTIMDILQLINEERAGLTVDCSLVKSLFQMFKTLDLYHEELEKPLLEATRLFYGEECNSLLQSLNAEQYIHYVDQRVHSEMERLNYYFFDDSKLDILKIIEHCLITQPMLSIVDKGLIDFIEKDKHDNLTMLFNLLNRVEGGQTFLFDSFITYVKNIGQNLFMKTGAGNGLIEKLILLKSKMDFIVLTCFGNMEKLIEALKKAFAYLLNTQSDRVSDYLALFIHSIMEVKIDSSKNKLDKSIDQVVSLLRFVDGKHAFGVYHRKYLARRLLMKPNVSIEAEKSVVDKLRIECGDEFTNRFEAMFKDMELSKQLNLEYRNLRGNDLSYIGSFPEFYVNILTAGKWPLYNIYSVNLPAELSVNMEAFQDFYKTKHERRSLKRILSLEHGILEWRSRENRTREIQVSLHQATVLLLFNDHHEYTTQDIAKATEIEKDELNRTLKSLACGKVKILLKNSETEMINDQDKFMINEDIPEESYLIRMNNMHAKRIKEKPKTTEQQPHLSRQYQIDAAIVRIIKRHGKLTHKELMKELKTELRFSFAISEIKVRIDSLIERVFIARDNQDSKIYHYIA